MFLVRYVDLVTIAETPSSRRLRSRQRLLDVIRRESGVTRSDLSRITGLSRSAIAEAAQDLLDDHLITEDVLGPGGKGAGRGRPSALLVAIPPRGVVVGVDFGHDHVGVAVAGTDGRVLAEQRTDLDVDHNSRSALDTASGMAFRLVATLGLSGGDVRSVVAGIPAPLDVETNRIRAIQIMPGWVDLNPAEELSRLFGRPVSTFNDAELGAQGELRFGAARGLRDFVYIKASEGIGASLVLNGKVYRGALGLSGEIGHTRVDGQSLLCRCGRRGCLETVVTSTVVTDRMRDAGLRPLDEVFPLAAIQRYTVMSTIVTDAGRTLGRILADLCNWINPAAVVLGGALGTAGQPLIDGVRESINRFAHPAAAESLDIKTTQLGLRSELLGAIAVACQQAVYEVA
jgi:predicted NBD/HSP70 family sugar kinase